LDLIRLNVLPPADRPPGARNSDLALLVIATDATRIVKSSRASPWEVFLCPQQAPRLAIHFRPRRQR
jgi:hypothetical protein